MVRFKKSLRSDRLRNAPRWRYRQRLSVPLALCIIGLSAGVHGIRADEPPAEPWTPPPLEQAVSLRMASPVLLPQDAASDSPEAVRATLAEGLDALARPAKGRSGHIVFLGETHTDETTHRLELAIYEGLRVRTGNRVVLSLEMFDRDVQGVLDQYLAGTIDEATFLQRSRPWNNYRAAYRPLIEAAKRHGLPVVAANFPRSLRRRVMIAGESGWDALRKESPRLVPQQLLPHSPLYWKRVDNAIRGHLAMMQLPDDPAKRLLSTQSLWDNTMAESCLTALQRHPGWTVLHVNGGFHSAYHDGTVRQVKLRAPQTDVRTVAIVPVGNPATAEIRGKPPADIVAFVEARAEDEHDGKWHVVVSRSMAYRMVLPAHASRANTDRTWGLLIWLGSDGLAAQDGLARWKSHLGDQIAVAVVEPTYRAEEADLSPGGRWFWPDSFAEDIGTAAETIERTWAYLMRHYPIHPDRVLLAGEGTGGTIVAATALRTDRMPVRAIAFRPKQYTKLRDLPLPIPELWGDDKPPARHLTVVVEPSEAGWWRRELDDYRKAKVDTRLTEHVPDPWERIAQEASLFRAALQASAEAPESGSPSDGRRLYLRLPVGATPRTRHWMQLQALHASRTHHRAVAVVPAEANVEGKELTLDVTPAQFQTPGRLPRCPGPFGGTTVLILDANTPGNQVAQWIALEKSDPIAARSRFHRLRIAVTDPQSERHLPKLLESLAKARRRNVLLVPATFAAGVSRMQQLKRLVEPLENQMTLQWLPGLGGQDAWFEE